MGGRHRNQESWVAFALIWPLLGCPSGPLASTSPAPARLEVLLPTGAPATVVDLGEVPVGDSVTQPLVLRNSGGTGLVLAGLSVLGTDSVAVDAPPPFAVLGPQEEVTAELVFGPRRDESIVGTLVIESTDLGRSATTLDIVAEALAPRLRATPSELEFADTSVGCSAGQTLELSNVGRLPLELFAVSMQPDGFAADFTEPTSIAPSAALELPLTFQPLAAGQLLGTLEVLSSDPEAPVQVIAVEGRGDVVTIEETFVQGAIPAVVDYLFVVDNGSSMGGEQASLATNLAALFAAVDQVTADYHVGVVTTDVGQGGLLQGPVHDGGALGLVRFVTNDTPDPAAAFAIASGVGFSGAEIEQGFDSAWLAIDPGAAINPGFLRETASLEVVFISDEDDQSTTTFPSASDLVVALQGLDPDVRLHVVTGGVSGCGSGPAGAVAAPRYLDAAQATGGLAPLLCAPDWAEVLQGAVLGTASADFPLAQAPVEATLEVLVDQQPASDWTWESETGSVRFGLGSLPPSGSLVSVRYAPLLDCEE